MKCYPMEPGEYTSYARQVYRCLEYTGTGDPCEECELPTDLCRTYMGQSNFCHPRQRRDGKQVLFKKRWMRKKRYTKRNITQKQNEHEN